MFCFVLFFTPVLKQTLYYLRFQKAGKKKKRVHSFLAAPGKMRVFGGRWQLFEDEVCPRPGPIVWRSPGP